MPPKKEGHSVQGTPASRGAAAHWTIKREHITILQTTTKGSVSEVRCYRQGKKMGRAIDAELKVGCGETDVKAGVRTGWGRNS